LSVRAALYPKKAEKEIKVLIHLWKGLLTTSPCFMLWCNSDVIQVIHGKYGHAGQFIPYGGILANDIRYIRGAG
jgi:hypothetical protein